MSRPVTWYTQPVTFLGNQLTIGGPDMPTVPIKPKKLPSAANFPNGSPPASGLRTWPGGQNLPLLTIPSYGMQAWHLYAADNGWTMRTTGRGRTYAQQEALFRARYQTASLDRPYKMWDGNGDGVKERWYQKPGVAQAAVPGTSNHGWWCADDMALELDGDIAQESVTTAFVEWAITVAHLFGWAWELQSEPWHVHWISGDVIPPFAVQVLRDHGVLPTDPVEPPEVPVYFTVNKDADAEPDFPSTLFQEIAPMVAVRIDPEVFAKRGIDINTIVTVSPDQFEKYEVGFFAPGVAVK